MAPDGWRILKETGGARFFYHVHKKTQTLLDFPGQICRFVGYSEMSFLYKIRTGRKIIETRHVHSMITLLVWLTLIYPWAIQIQMPRSLFHLRYLHCQSHPSPDYLQQKCYFKSTTIPHISEQQNPLPRTSRPDVATSAKSYIQPVHQDTPL